MKASEAKDLANLYNNVDKVTMDTIYQTIKYAALQGKYSARHNFSPDKAPNVLDILHNIGYEAYYKNDTLSIYWN
jgi:hypothetical protein